MKKGLLPVLLACGLGWSAAVHAVPSNPNVKVNEWRLLPPACMYVEGAPGRRSDTARKLHASDPTWVHMHHYCWAIVQTFRTYRHTISQKGVRDYLNAAVGNLDYTIERSQPGFVLRPDMFVRKTALLVRLGNFIEAANAARQLIAESPELPEGYVALADVQIKAGRPEQARETLAHGDEAVKDKTRFEAMKKQLALP